MLENRPNYFKHIIRCSTTPLFSLARTLRLIPSSSNNKSSPNSRKESSKSFQWNFGVKAGNLTF